MSGTPSSSLPENKSSLKSLLLSGPLPCTVIFSEGQLALADVSIPFLTLYYGATILWRDDDNSFS
jgi:hypothetical protein